MREKFVRGVVAVTAEGAAVGADTIVDAGGEGRLTTASAAGAAGAAAAAGAAVGAVTTDCDGCSLFPPFAAFESPLVAVLTATLLLFDTFESVSFALVIAAAGAAAVGAVAAVSVDAREEGLNDLFDR